jgi:hypothetical protein
MGLPDDVRAHREPGAGVAVRVRLIAILRSARRRKSMYFTSIEPRTVIDWLSGLRTGCTLAGLEWSPEDRRPVLERRGLEFTSAWENGQLAARGLSPEAIADELLAIEIEMWEQVSGPAA